MKLIEKNGLVDYIMAAGGEYVSAKMPLAVAEKMLVDGTKRASSRFPGFPVRVNGEYYFSAKSGKADKKKDGSDEAERTAETDMEESQCT